VTGDEPDDAPGPAKASGAALATLLGVALGFLSFKGIFEQEELAAIFSLAEEMLAQNASPIGQEILSSAKETAALVQAELDGSP
jgi:hypothetical protein